ncbi:MAG: D-alanyl-D-alanine carboxypeptidase family protein [Evtepia gabavorous]
MKKFFATFLCLVLCGGLLPAQAAGPEVNAKAVLLMEKTTGQVLYEEHAHDPLELASVTKVMTMLLIMEALEEGTITKETMVPVSATAAGMGGSQVYMKEGESFSVHDMLKAIAVASGNDACMAMAEYLAGSESAFVEKMNARAAELGMENTVFVNCTGLPAEGHHSSAYDIALMSRALIQNHPDIRTYTTIWMDTLRDGTFQLANTNKLIRFYEGATGLKTGSTDAALYCVSATAEKDGMELIAVVLGSPTSADRFETAKALLNYGFAGYSLVTVAPSEPISPIPVTWVPPQRSRCSPRRAKFSFPRRAGKVSTTLSLPTPSGPVEKGQELGSLTVLVDGKENQKLPLVAQEEVPRLTLWAVYQSLLGTLFCGT